ncbi:hypothetical protein PCASD_17561 [Puccinia coronata f. sp. avenae]|uniref:Uncharacterized protein n=1 Tax=Puccinia coronata f. sp. avenae TaxID=200324 RepID=A0A2N5U5X1_9BASI|nr:hypothetical protein PCASD_17561 [Puccinia coronata f. sp. avenae]
MYDFLGLLALNDSGAGLGSVVQRRWCSITHQSTRIQSSMPAFVYLASRLKLWMWLSRCSWSAPPQQHLDLFGSLQGLNRELSPVFPTHDLVVHTLAHQPRRPCSPDLSNLSSSFTQPDCFESFFPARTYIEQLIGIRL